MRNFVMFVGAAVAFAGCDLLESAETTAGEAAEAAEEAVEEAGEAAGAAAEAVEAAAATAGTALKDVVAEASASMGKDIVVMGNFQSTAVSEDTTTVMLSAGTEEGAPTLACVVSADNKAQFENMDSNAMVQVKGTLTQKDGQPVIENCTRVEGDPVEAMAEEAAEAAGDAAEAAGAAMDEAADKLEGE